MDQQEKNRFAERVAKILSLSNSGNEHEAAAAAAKAQELLSQYNLTMADVEGINHEDRERASLEPCRTRQTLERWAYTLAWYTSDAFDCGYYHSCDERTTVFVGVGADARVCCWTFEFLYRNLQKYARAYVKDLDPHSLLSDRERQILRRSFLVGATETVGSRLLCQKKKTPVTSKALVPVKQRLIDKVYAEAGVRRRRQRPVRIAEGAYQEGRRTGDSICLSTPVTEDSENIRLPR
ncbi:MAG: DUF2786 domain-containing protein [Desulfovibrio sp.]|nr:DUF2786 domain-containing protein [Desulfovibrio sp.]